MNKDRINFLEKLITILVIGLIEIALGYARTIKNNPTGGQVEF